MAVNQLKAGAILSYVTIVVTNIVGLLLTPYILTKLGVAEYGLYTLMGAFVGYMTLLDFGLNNTIVRFVAKYRAEKDSIGEASFLGMSIFIYGMISLVLVLIGGIFYMNLEGIFESSMTAVEIEKAKLMFAILIFNLAFTLVGNSFSAVASGYEKFIYPKSVNIIKYILRSILLVVILFFGAKAVGMIVLDTIMNLLLISANAYYIFKVLKVKVSFSGFNKPLLKEVFKYSVWIFVFAIVGQFQWKSGQMVLGVLTNTSTVAIFAIGIMLGSYYGAFSSAITSVFLPRATKMAVEEATGKELTDMMIRVGRISFLVLLYVLGAFFLYGEQFIILWVGTEFIESWQIAMLIMFAYTVPLVQGFGNSILEAKGKLAFKAVLYLSFVIIGTVIGALFAPKYGATGMIIGSVSGWLVSQNIMNIYYTRVIKLNILRFFKELAIRFLICMIGILSLGWLINLIPGNNWINFLIKAVLYTGVYAGVMFQFGMRYSEKELIWNLLKRKKNSTRISESRV
ncbi:oligosaccharide flippase family protein [Ancylomarina sp. 16SWW S1-10-2]|uniref:oligosaccharide flippase family protein n=1 Tax=Ancylomarina sp. 16SWW S1-10-2 TaxID=2499681 RepID=UPI0012AE5FA2|nr:oligosaccharide flippase family protein [Ancylomarina sp. 16SWW S1-10-2]MRT93462.1 polysaccharide biosynthesis protein [Ancylomarina sp. 16SWW S1-10-2]